MASFYKGLIRPILFQMDPEKAHHFSMQMLKCSAKLRLPLGMIRALYGSGIPKKPVELCGLRFPNPVGIAAGLDKDGEAIEALFAMGFGFIEVGTVTPEPQPGNPKPRLFRYPETEAVVNRMGFNNAGAAALKQRIVQFKKRYKGNGILGVNIGKQKTTKIAEATGDYLSGYRNFAEHADYIAANISSPNTPNLRELQGSEHLVDLLSTLKAEEAQRHSLGLATPPLFLKIAPDLAPEAVQQIVELLLEHEWDGIIATNTTIDREGDNAHYESPGGLSGKPLKERSTEIIRQISEITAGKLPIIGVGGIQTTEDACEKLDAGASLVQVYSGFIYEGPGMAKAIVSGL